MLLPKRVKYRRVHRGRLTGKAMRGNKVTYGEFGLVAVEPAWITSNQIEAARIAMTRYTKRGGQVWIYKGEILSQALRTTPRTLDTSKPYQERRDRRGRRDGDRRGGFRRDGQNGGFNRDRRDGNRPQGGFRKPAEKKEGGAQ